jgi:hypothetical protein
MPRTSDKRKVLLALEADIHSQEKLLKSLRSVANNPVAIDSDNENKNDDDSTMNNIIECHQLVLDAVKGTYDEINNRQYLMDRKPYRTGLSFQVFECDLQQDDNINGSPPWLNDTEFLQTYQMHWESFNQLLQMIQDHSVFSTDIKKEQAPVSHQLLLFLHYLGKSGRGANNPQLCNMFQIGRGTADHFKRRCITAIWSLRETAINWPDKEERKIIAKRILVKHSWMNCIGIVDGTLFPLT